MDLETFRNFCISLKGVTEEMPFGENTLVFKVENKMFALTGIDYFTSINIKCNPEEAIDLRERYPAVQPGYHMNKLHWNTILMDYTIDDSLILNWTKNSYNLVVAKLPKNIRAAYQ